MEVFAAASHGVALMPARRFSVLFVLTPALHPNEGGVQMSTCKLGRYFLHQGHDVGVFSFASEGHDQSQPMRLFHARHPGNAQERLNLSDLEVVLRDFQPDIVINQMPYEHQIGKLLKENKRYLLLGCLRNTLYSVKRNLEAFVTRTAPGPIKQLAGFKPVQQAFLWLHRARHRADLRKILDIYDHFVMFAPANLEELRYFVPEFCEEKIRLVPNSIPVVATTVPPKEKRLLWLGRVAHQQKRAELILPIWERVRQSLPDWSLDVVGSGPLLETLQAEAVRKRLSHVQFYGRQVPDPYYRRATIFFMTSAFEGFPNTLVEAQSYGTIPVVFDSYPMAKWIVEDGVNGHLVRPFDIDAMAQQIVDVAQHSERERFAKSALESARRFHIDQVGQIWQDLFEAEVAKHARQSKAGEAMAG